MAVSWNSVAEIKSFAKQDKQGSSDGRRLLGRRPKSDSQAVVFPILDHLTLWAAMTMVVDKDLLHTLRTG